MGKILLINTVPTEKNGITNVIFNYLMAIDKGCGTFDYVSLNHPDIYYLNIIDNKGGRVYVIPRSSKQVLSYWNGLRKLIKEKQYDAVHIHGNSHTVILELFAAKIAGCKTRIVHAHSTKCNSIALHKALTFLFNKLCTHRIACGKEAGLFMFEGYPFVVMNNGIDTEKYTFSLEKRRKIREQLGWKQCIIIGHVGYFMAIKNQSFIVDVFEYLYNQNRDYRLVLIGDGPLKETITEKLTSKSLADVSLLTGSINNVDEYLNTFDIIVMPSLFEGVPLTLIEQQANGLQCVVSDNITREVDKTGNVTFLSLDDGAKKWTDIISNIEINDEDRMRRSTNAIKKIKECGYSIQEEAKKLQGYYSKIIQK